MNTTMIARLGLATLLAIPSLSLAQHKPRPADEMARDYNKGIQPINDEIDALRNKLNNSDLSMSESAKLIEQQSALRRKAESLWNETEGSLVASFKQAREARNAYNASNRNAAYEGALIGSMTGVGENIGKYPKKSDFEQYKPAMSADWEKNFGSRLKPFGEEVSQKKEEIFQAVKEKFGIDLAAQGYRQIGTSNPYNGDYYYRYYDNEGKLRAGVMRETIENLAKWQEANAASNKRQRDLKDQLAKEGAGLTTFQGQFKQGRTATGQALSAVEAQARKVNFAGNWSGRDSVGNSVRLQLGNDGSMTWSWSGRDRPTSYTGTWTQVGKQISMRTNDGSWTAESTITEETRLQFTSIRGTDGKRFTEYLNR